MKRAIDFCLAALTLVVLSPVFLLVGLLIRIRMGAPILFRHSRPGLHGKPFLMLKFRTMLDSRDAHGKLLEDSARLTPLGRFLRATSIDELPELWNVLKGDMSLVGPRPLLLEYLPLYTVEQSRRHEVPPGITGWAQVNGRNAISWDHKFALDVWYVDNRSLWLDIRILARTVLKVFARQGISAEGEATMPRFEGSKS